MAGQSSPAQVGPPGQVLDGDVVVEVCLGPLEGVGHGSVGVRGDGPADVLGLTALAMGCDDHPSGQLVGRGGAEVLPD